MKSLLLTLSLLASLVPHTSAADDFPPGWLPVELLGPDPSWEEYRENKERVHLYLPEPGTPVRGIFVSYIFHSADPRELADLWNFALVTIPFPFEYDLGHNDKRNGRFKLGHDLGNMGRLLSYLDAAAQSTGHKELSTVPIVGWLGQNGSHLCADLLERAPHRVLAWADAFPNRLRSYPDMTTKIPFAFAWEISKSEERSGTRSYRDDELAPADLSCRANTYGFPHGIYSKYNFFSFFLDRCIRARLPDPMPEPGQPVTLKPAVRADGWVGDFDPIGSSNPIHPAGSPESESAKYPVWLPDAYAAHAWRAYHSNCQDLKILTPKAAYRSTKGPESDWGFGYGGTLSAADSHSFTAEVTGDYSSISYHDGDTHLGDAKAPHWKLTGVKLGPGLRVLFAVGIKPDGSKSASRPALVIVK